MADTAQVHITDRPNSVVGTPAFRGPYAKLRGDLAVKVVQGAAVVELVMRGHTFRSAAGALGLSLTTTWRRYWFVLDWHSGNEPGRPPGPIPHQRGTRACPNGAPIVLPRDARRVFGDLLDAGIPAGTIAASWRALPACVRDLAISHMARQMLDEPTREWLAEQRDGTRGLKSD